MIKKSIGVLCSFLLLSACGEADTSTTADMVLYGGPIYTANDATPMVGAVAVKDGRIIYAGDRDGLKSYKGQGTESVDLKGAAMYPGFTDAHGHLLGIGQREMTLNLEGLPSLQAMMDVVAKRIETATPGEVITGRGWIETHWPEGRFPNRHDLDLVAPDNPVILGRADGHARVINTAGLKAAGITAATKAPYGGDILKDDAGEPTGMLIDAAMGLVAGLLSDPTEAERALAFQKGGDVYAAYGWTGVHSMSVAPRNVAVMEVLSDSDALSIRVYNSLDGDNPASMEMLRQGPRSSDNGRVITRAIKLYMDGALGSRGAALLQPYSDAETSGLLLSKKDQVMPMLVEALERGIQMNTHAIGDRGNRLLLDWYEEAMHLVPADLRAIEEPRWRDEHTQIVHPDDIPRFKAMGVIPSMQPSHAIGDLHFAPARLGDDRLHGAYAWQSFIKSGVIVAGGSDAPVERGDPRIEFYGAVSRKDMSGYAGDNWHMDEAVTRDEALKMFTLWPAIASFQEKDLGSIEVGKKADFTVFSHDIMTIDEADILNVATVMTVVDGVVVYK